MPIHFLQPGFLQMSDIVVQYEDHMGDDLAVVNAAKVSFGKRSEWANVEEMWVAPFIGESRLEMAPSVKGILRDGDVRLINYLARGCTVKDWDAILAEIILDKPTAYALADTINHYRDMPLHKSPFNHCYARFHVTAPIFVARQLVKHEYMPWNEISGRYVEFEADFFQPHTFRAKADNKKQGSGEELNAIKSAILQDIFDDAHQHAYESYKEALLHGLCEEQARSLLPLDTQTQWVWSGSVGAISKMCKLRLAPDAQYESRLVAEAISKEMSKLYPIAWAALMTNGRAAY
jgi:thymidylate synthase (FAD)